MKLADPSPQEPALERARWPRVLGMVLRAVILGELLFFALLGLYAARNGAGGFVYIGF